MQNRSAAECISIRPTYVPGKVEKVTRNKPSVLSLISVQHGLHSLRSLPVRPRAENLPRRIRQKEIAA